MQNNLLKNIDKLLNDLEVKKIALIQNQQYEEAKVIRDKILEIDEKLQNLFEMYKDIIED